MQKTSEERREDVRTCPISQVERTFAVYLSRLQCGETQFFIWNLIQRTSFNLNIFRLQHRNMQCKSMWSPITRPQRRNQQTYKFLACSKFQWIGVRWRSSQLKKLCLNYCDLYTNEIWKGMCISVSFIFSYMMQNLWFK